MTDMTSVISVRTASLGWKAFWVQTQSSMLLIGLYDGTAGGRPLAVLKGHSGSSGRELRAQDSAPRVGDRSLFDVPPAEWVGARLEIGGTTTSPVVRVDPELAAQVVGSLTLTGAASKSKSLGDSLPGHVHMLSVGNDATWSPFPLNNVEYLEEAAILIRKVARNRAALAAVVKQDAAFRKKFEQALEASHRALEGLL